MIKFLALFVILFTAIVCQQKIFYLHKTHQDVPQNLNTKGFMIDPEIVPINCDIKDCSRYRPSQYPSMVFWAGAGFAFQKISPPTQQQMRQHLARKQVGPINRLKIWIESLSEFETVIFAFVSCTFLYIVFTFLCSPRKKQKPQ